MEGSLHAATMAKTAGALVGYITRASLNNGGCVAGSATVLTTNLPWHVRYAGFLGVLPDITAVIVDIIGAEFRISGPFGTCLFTTTVAQPNRSTFNLSRTHTVTVIETAAEVTSNENCGAFGERISGRIFGDSATNTAGAITLI